MVNQVAISGNVTRRPDLKVSKSGVSRALFTVAVNTGNRDDDNEKTHFVAVTAFGSLAENVAESIDKGDRVTVSGRFDSYQREVFDEDGDAFDMNVLTVIANVVGPDLTWASAEIAKNARKSRSQEDPYDEDEAPAKPKAKKAKAKAKVEDDEGDEDEVEEKPVKKAKKAKAKPEADDGDDGDDF